MIQLYPTNFPPSNTPITDEKGAMTNASMAFFRALYDRTGYGNGLTVQANPSVTAAGTTATGATLLSADWNYVVGANGLNGVGLPALIGGQMVIVYNSDIAGNLNVYDPAQNIAIALNPTSMGFFWFFSSTLIVSKQL